MKISIKTTERLTADERRITILEAAIVEFADKGLHGASTETVAEHAGISQPYIFRLFGTKQELFIAAVDLVCERIMEEFRTAVAVHPNQPLDAMAASFSRLMTRHDELVLLFQAFAAANKPETMALGRQQLGKMYTYVAEVSGASDDELRVFFAHGMLMAVAATMRLPEIAGECPWAKNLSEMKKPGALALLHTSVHSEQT